MVNKSVNKIVGKGQLAIGKVKLPGLLMAFLFYLSTGNCQLPTVSLRADSNHIQIGDPLNIRLTLNQPANLGLPFPAVADTLGNLEVVSVSKTDTTTEGDKKVLSRVYTVSAYDSGEFHAGPVKIYFKNNAGELDSVESNDIAVTVNTLDVDTAKPFKGIKAPLEVPYNWREFTYYYIAALLLLIAIVVGVLLYKKYKRQKPVVAERPKPRDPAHIWARRELKKLEEEKLWQKDEVKLYYSRLTDIVRFYLEFRYGWYAMESTTEEIQSEMQKYNLKEKAKDSLLAILRAADLVKFAKMIPMPDANMKAMENAYKLIDFTEQAENKDEKKNV
jgi:hypothetical protein